jgi:hypothetical protein
MSTRAAAAKLIAEKFGRPHPIPRGEKGPRLSGWQDPNRVFAPEDFDDDGNIGTLLVDLVDIDHDCPEAVIAAPMLLLKTGRISGRIGTGQSHYWYRVNGELKPEQFKDIDGKVLVEIRTGASQQTVLPPSTHPSGETVTWYSEREEGKVDAEALRLRVVGDAVAALLARHWPNGSRHKAAVDAAGFLAARGLDAEMVVAIIKAAATAAKDDEIPDRVRAASDSVKAFASGGKTSGGPSLAASLTDGDKVIARLKDWFGMSSAILDAVEMLNAKHFIVTVGSAERIGTEYADDHDVIFQRREDLALRYSNLRVQVGVGRNGRPVYDNGFKLWLEHPKHRQYRRFTFAPPPRVVHGDDYNLWRGFAVEPMAGCVDRYLAHARDVICSGNQSYADYLLDLMAHAVQFPGRPPGIAAALRGRPGAGKSLFIRTFGDLFGRHYVHLDRGEQLVGKFNAHLSGKVVVFADEAVWGGTKQQLGALKRLITEPTLQVERKGIDEYAEPNCVHLFTATNEDWHVPAGPEERRWFVLDVSDAKMQDFDYFGKLVEEIERGGRAALLHFLLNRKIDLKILHRAPRTSALRRQQSLSLAPEMAWWEECLTTGTIGGNTWPAWLSCADAHTCYLIWCETVRSQHRLSAVEFGRRLSSFFGLSGLRKRGGQVVRGYTVSTLEEAREKFDSFLGTPGAWIIESKVEARDLVDEPRESSGDIPF